MELREGSLTKRDSRYERSLFPEIKLAREEGENFFFKKKKGYSLSFPFSSFFSRELFEELLKVGCFKEKMTKDNDDDVSHAGGEMGESDGEHGGVRAGRGGSREIDHLQGGKSERDGAVPGGDLENRRRV